MSELISRQKLIEEVKKQYFAFVQDDTDLWWNRAISAAIEIIESQPPADQWIPCSERLPDKTGNYLVTSKGCTWVAHWFYHTWWGIEKECRWTDVEAWMPLPEPYKGGMTK